LPLYVTKPEESSLAIEDLNEYDFPEGKGKVPWLQVFLLASVLLPFLVVLVLILTIIIIICVYLKENFKGLKNMILKSDGDDRRYDHRDRDYENKILKQ